MFFELGRKPAAASAQGLRALRLDEMMRHIRLQAPEQIVACLKVIHKALQHVCGQPDAALTALDGAGHCLAAAATARSIVALWEEIVAARKLAPPEVTMAQPALQGGAPSFQAPYAISVPAFTAPERAGSAATG